MKIAHSFYIPGICAKYKCVGLNYPDIILKNEFSSYDHIKLLNFTRGSLFFKIKKVLVLKLPWPMSFDGFGTRKLTLYKSSYKGTPFSETYSSFCRRTGCFVASSEVQKLHFVFPFTSRSYYSCFSSDRTCAYHFRDRVLLYSIYML
jgi:hypothetical protein